MALSAGEGGMVCGTPALVERVRKLANFGLEPTVRHAHGVVYDRGGTNAKMSEYHAAVALASLDAWEAAKAARARLAAAYLERLPGLFTLPNAGVYTTFPVLVDNAEQVAVDMASRGVEARRWYTPTLDMHPAFASLPREGSLKRAHTLASEILCLPFHLHMTDADVDEVCEVFEWAAQRNRKSRVVAFPVKQSRPSVYDLNGYDPRGAA